MIKDLELFGGRYLVDIGSKGAVTVKSRALRGKHLKVYGKVKEGCRYVNLIEHKDVGSLSYDLEAIKDFCLNGGELMPMTEEQVKEASRQTELPPLLNDTKMIESLDHTLDRFNNKVFIEYLEDHTRYYTKQYLNLASNGYSKFRYNVQIKSVYDNYARSDKTQSFICDYDSVAFYNVNQVNDEELKELLTIINNEIKTRKTNEQQ